MFYNSFRSTSKEPLRKTNHLSHSTAGSKSVGPKEKIINLQKREKLKNLLITKFMKKYGIKHADRILHDEISKFLEGEKLTDEDLKKLDEKLRRMITEKEDNENLRRNLTEPQDKRNDIKEAAIFLPDLNKAETMSVHSKASKMSGGSKLSKYENKNNKDAIEDFDNLSVTSEKKPIKRFDFINEGDEWNAICMHNKKVFEEEKKMNKLKDMEIKRRTKDDLDNQIRQKLKRLNEDHQKNAEYDYITLQHTHKLNEIENEKQAEMKAKILKEKENRDRQLKDEKLRKKQEIVKQKKYEQELGI
jgi:hypothetical protein